jgi:protein O-mannosyl-transferase
MSAKASHIPSPIPMRLLLLAAILLTFGRIISNDFVDWDDGTLIYDNPNVTDGTAGLARAWSWHDPHTFGLYDPLVYTTWWVLARAAKLQTPDALGATINPQIFHAANLLVHWLAACVVLEILCRMGLGAWPAFAAALLFAVHPLQTEAVAWATGMKDLLGGLLAMGSIWRYLLAAENRGRGRRNNYIVATLLFLLALLAKPSAAVLPFIVMSLDVILYRRPLRRSLAWAGPWLLPAAAATAITMSIQPAARLHPPPLWSRPLIAGDALAFYLGKLVAPIHLSFEYGRTPGYVLGEAGLYWHWILPVIAGLVAWRLGRRAIAAGAVFFLGLLPVLGFIPFKYQYFSTVADRYMYVPMLGIAMAAGFFLARFGNRMVWCCAGFVLISMMALSFVQAGRWKDTDTLYSYALSLHRTTGMHYMIAAEYQEKEADLAVRRRNVDLAQGNAAAARAEDQRAREDVRKAVGYRRQELMYDPTDAEALHQLPLDLDFLGERSR